MGVYEERAPPTTGMHWQPPTSQERGSGLALSCQGGPGGNVGGPSVVDQARDLSPCLPASMGDAARPTTLPCSPPAAHHHGSHRTPLHQTHCGTNNNCYDSSTTPYDTRDYESPGAGEFRNSNFEHTNDLNATTQTGGSNHHNHNHHHHHHLHHHHHHPHHHQSQVHQLSQHQQHQQQHHQQQLNQSEQRTIHEEVHTVPKLEPPPTPPAQSEDVPGVVCAGCGLRIADRFYLQAVDRRWHAACLQCSHCRQGLDGEASCFSRDGNIYCKMDYYKMFYVGSMKRCSRCKAAILASEFVMRARELVFHVRCFSCATCAIPLTKGDHFGMRDGDVLCRLHYEMGAELHPSQSPPAPVYPPGPHYPGQSFPSPEFLHHHVQPHHHSMHPQHPHQLTHQSPVSLQPSTPSGPEVGSPPKVPYFNGTAQAVGGAAGVPPPRQKGRPRKRKPKDLEAMTASLDLNSEYIDMPFGRGPGTPGMTGSNSRTKRMRTSFKHHQLRTMKSYFAINHNPDAKDLKQLSQKTGLPKRVLQVWFQNARAKWRRMVLKQEGKSDKCGSVDGSSLGDLELYGNSTGSGGAPMSPPFMLGGPHSPASLGSLDCA